MVGDPSAAILADAVAFGATGFDVTKALHDAVAAATNPNVGTGVLAERTGLSDYLALGYVPIGATYVPASTSLEYYSEDYAVAALARTLGDDADAKTLAAHAAEWPTLYDPATGQIEPRNGDGSFSLDDSQFIEGNAAQYTWMLPFDMGGLVARMGGPAQAQQRLDAFFSQFASDPFAPYAWMGNEPSLGTPWAYDFTGSPWKTQATVRQIMTSFYGDSSTGTTRQRRPRQPLILVRLGRARHVPADPRSRRLRPRQPALPRSDAHPRLSPHRALRHRRRAQSPLHPKHADRRRLLQQPVAPPRQTHRRP